MLIFNGLIIWWRYTMKKTLLGAVMALAISIGITQVDAAPIHEAARTGDTLEMEHLLQNGEIDLNIKHKGRTPLMWAAAKGHRDVVTQLLKAGADVDVQASDGFTALMLSKDTNIIVQLLKARADVNIKSPSGWTALSWAANWNYRDAVEQLLQVPGIDVNAAREGNTALMLAAYSNKRDIVELLLQHPNIDIEGALDAARQDDIKQLIENRIFNTTRGPKTKSARSGQVTPDS